MDFKQSQKNKQQSMETGRMQNRQLMQGQLPNQGWLDHYSGKLSEISKIEQEIKQGPPSDISKWEQDRWKEQKQRELQQAKKQGEAAQKFFASSRELVDQMNNQLDSRRSQTEEELSTGQILEAFSESTVGLAKQDWKKLVGKEQDSTGQIAKLVSMLEKLEGFTAASFTAEEAAGLVEEYNKLDLERKANASQYLDETGAMDPQSCYLLLCHCVAAALKYQLTDLDKGVVDEELFLKLYSMSSAYTVAAATLCVSDSFQEKRNENAVKLAAEKKEQEEKRRQAEEAEKKRQAEEAEKMRQAEEAEKMRQAEEAEKKRQAEEAEKKRRERNRKAGRKYLQTGMTEKDKPEKWLIGEYAELVEPELKELMEKEYVGKEFVDKVEQMENLLRINIPAIEQYVKGHSDKVLELPGVREKVCQAIRSRMGSRLLHDPLDQELEEELKKEEEKDGLLKQGLAECGLPIEQYRNRQEKILNRFVEWKDYPGLWMNQDFLALVMEKDDAKFKLHTEMLYEQTSVNLELAREMISANLSQLSSEEAMKALKQKHGDILISGSTRQMNYTVTRFLMFLDQEAPQVRRIDEDLENAMAELKIPRYFQNAACESVLKEKEKGKTIDTGLIKRSMSNFQELLNAHKADFEACLNKNGETWNKAQKEAAIQWMLANIQEEKTKFQQGLDALIKTTSFQNLTDSDRNKGARKLKIRTRNNAERLCSKGLCEWENEIGNLKGYEEQVREALEKLLKNGELKKSYLKDVHNLEDLDNLTEREFRDLQIYFQNNMLLGIQIWSNIRGVFYEEKVKQLLIADLLKGELNSENVEQRAKEEAEKLLQNVKENELRTDMALRTKMEKPESVQVLYEKGKENKGWFSTESVTAKRMQHCKNAERIWRIFTYSENAHLREEVLDLIQKEGPDKVHEYIMNLLKKRNFSNPPGVDEDPLIPEEILAWSKADYVYEFMLCQTEAGLFNQGGAGEEVFLKAEDKEYRQKLVEYGKCMAARRAQVDDLFKKRRKNWEDEVYGAKYFSKEASDYWLRMSKMAAGLEPFEVTKYSGNSHTEIPKKIRERNKKCFGVGEWDDAVESLRNYLDNQNKEVERKESDSRDNSYQRYQESNQVVDFLKERKRELETYEGGLFRNFVPQMLENPDFWHTMVYGSEEELLHCLELMKVPLQALKGQTSGETFYFYYDQILLKYGKEIVNVPYTTEKSRRTEAQWGQIFGKYIADVGKVQVAGKPIRERLEGSRLFCNPNWKSMLKPGEDPVSVIMDDKRLQEVSDAVQKRMDVNKEFYESRKKENEEFQRSYAELTDKQKERLDSYVESLITLPAKEFQNKAIFWFRDIKQLYPEKKSIKQESVKQESALDKLARIAGGIEKQKKRGREADQKNADLLKQLREQVWGVGSPVLAVLGRKKKLTEKDVEKANQEVSEIESPIQRNLLLEMKLCDNPPEEEAVKNWLHNTCDHVEQKQFGKEKSRLSEETANQFLTWLFVQESRKKRWGAKGVSETELEEQYARFAQLQGLLQDVKYLEVGLPKTEYSGEIEQELKDFVSVASMGLYTLREKEFETLLKGRIHYFIAAAKAEKIFAAQVNGLRTEEKMGEDLCRKYVVGLREYFRVQFLDVKKELSEEELTRQVREMLYEPDRRRYLYHSDTLMDRVSSQDLTGKDIVSHAVKSREDFEEFLIKSKDEKILQDYNELDEQQRQVFALALMAPGQFRTVQMLPGSSLVRNEAEEQEEQRRIGIQLQEYIHHQQFEPAIDYNIVLEKLKDGDSINKEVFNNALSFTRLCIHQYQDNIPKNWERLKDAETSIQAAIFLSPKARSIAFEDIPPVESPEKLQEKLLELYAKENQKISFGTTIMKGKLEDKLRSLQPYQLPVLIDLLQDRTVLDRTTKVGFLERMSGEIQGFANEEKRQEIKNFYGTEGGNIFGKLKMGTSTCTRAFTVLCSYQIRDDVDLTNRMLGEDDFADGSLQRETVVDWELLGNALDMLEEVEHESLRLAAVRESSSPEMIEQSDNEKAKEQYRRYKDQTMDQDALESFLKEQAGKDGEELLFAGYKSLEPRERELFIKALGKREILDISEDRTWYNILAEEPDYVNQSGRDELMDEYLKNTMGEAGGITLQKDDCRLAFQSVLSNQIDDRMNFSKMAQKGTLLKDAMVREGTFVKTVRNTAVDWNLVQNALQFVRRTANERAIYREDQELFLAQGNVLKTGHFRFESGYFRKSRYQSGNSVTRHLKQRGKMRTAELIEKYVPKAAQLAIRALLPAEWSNAVNRTDLLPKEDALDQIKEQLKEQVAAYTDNENVSEVIDSVSEKIKGKSKFMDAVMETAQERAEEKGIAAVKELMGNEIASEAVDIIVKEVKESGWDTERIKEKLCELAEEKLKEQMNSLVKEKLGEGMLADSVNKLLEKAQSREMSLEEFQDFAEETLKETATDALKEYVGSDLFSGAVDTIVEKLKDNAGIEDITESVLEQLKEDAVEQLTETMKAQVKDYVGDEAFAEFLDLVVEKAQTGLELEEIQEELISLAGEKFQEKLDSLIHDSFGEGAFADGLSDILKTAKEEGLDADAVRERAQKALEDTVAEQLKAFVDNDLFSEAVDTVKEKMQEGDADTETIVTAVAEQLKEPVKEQLKQMMAEQLKAYVGDENFTQLLDKVLSDQSGKDVIEILRDNKTLLLKTVKPQIKKIGVQVGIDSIEAVLDIAVAGENMYSLYQATEAAKEKGKEDQEKNAETREKLDEKRWKLVQRSLERNLTSQKIAYSNAMYRQEDILVSKVSTIAGEITEYAVEVSTGVKTYGLIKGAVQEAGEFINLVRGYFNDEESVVRYFKKTGELDRLKERISKEGVDVTKYSDIDILMKANGYKNLAGIAYYIGVNLTRSLLFCAGPFNTQQETRLRAIAVLVSIGMEQAIGLQDNDTAETVLKALIGEQR